MCTLLTNYKLGLYFISVNLFEGISVGLETDFHHLERIDDNSLSQAWAEPCNRQRLGRRWTWFSTENVDIVFGSGEKQNRQNDEDNKDVKATRSQCRVVLSFSESSSWSVFVLCKTHICFCHSRHCCCLMNASKSRRHLCLLSLDTMWQRGQRKVKERKKLQQKMQIW